MKEKARILVIDDEKNIRRSVQATLEDEGYRVSLAEGALQALEIIRREPPDLVILDIRMGEISGIQLFQKLKNEGISIPTVFISGNATLSEAVETIRLGATDFLEKPFQATQLILAVERVLRLSALEERLQELSKSEPEHMGMVGQTSAMLQLRELIQRIAPTRSKVLIQGESGSGKELIARAIHQQSQVARGPFVKVNCAAIPSELIESELFGHERGAFTGANQLRRGLFELAHGGTIFLDEIAEMSAGAQAKVLRILQSSELTRVGGSAVIRVDVRVIAATHRDLAEEVKAGRFREDLYFRINVVPIRAIPLRERRDDLPVLVAGFIKETCRENGFAPKEITAEALDALGLYPWPGNVRELKNLIERLVVLSGPKIELANVPEEYRVGGLKGGLGPEASTEGLTLQSFKAVSERKHLLDVLRKVGGNVSQAARLLDIERTHLHRKISEHEIRKSEYFS